ncbi:MAG: GGDEF domain-containing protein [Thermoleophilaceae bacterium]|nr:GGDEF domain-containing protein [Thermoleophilaceae bacterium]
MNRSDSGRARSDRFRVVGGRGVQRMNVEVRDLYENQYRQTLASSQLRRSLGRAQTGALLLIQTNDPRLQERFNTRLALRTTIHENDFCARWGGEEFLILLPQTDAQGTRAAAEKARAAIGKITVPAVQRPISASLGVAVLPLHAVDVTGLVRSADRALYMAKAAGRNRVEMVEAGETHLGSRPATMDPALLA